MGQGERLGNGDDGDGGSSNAMEDQSRPMCAAKEREILAGRIVHSNATIDSGLIWGRLVDGDS